MTDRPHISAREQILLTAKLLKIPAPYVRQVAARMKSDGRLPGRRPIAASVTPQSLARLVLGLCAPMPSKSTDLEMQLGALPRSSGDGAETAELELENLIAEAVGIVDGDIDFWNSDVLIGVTQPVVGISVVKFDGTSTYRAYRTPAKKDDGMNHFVRLPLQTLRMLALELMGD